jgi:hypothetical protein
MSNLIGGVVLVRVLWSALAATVVVSVTFSLAILGLVRLTDLRAEGRSRPAAAYGVLAGGASVAFIAAVVYGVILVTQKS